MKTTEAEIEVQKEENKKSLNMSIGLDKYIAKKDACKDYDQHTTGFIFADGYSDGFQDGAKWGYEKGYEDCRHYAHDYYKPKWHYLQENPNDLPTEEDMLVRVIISNKVELICSTYWHSGKIILRSSFYGASVNDSDIIAWCELPHFKRI